MLSKILYRQSKSSLRLISSLLFFSVLITSIIARAGNIITQEIQTELAPSVGWDIVVEGSLPLPREIISEIEKEVNSKSAEISEKVEMNYTLTTPEWPLLISLRWVQDNFPLYGEFDEVKEYQEAPWISISWQLYETLFEGNEERKEVDLQGKDFLVESTFWSAPWTSFSVFDGWRLIVIPLEEVNKIGLLWVGSRVSYKVLIKWGDELWNLKNTIESVVANQGGYRVTDLNQSEGVFSSVGDTIGEYLSLLSLIFLLLQACVLVFLGSRMVNENQSALQVMRIFWRKDSSVMRSVGVFFAVVLGMSFLISLAATYWLSQYLFVEWLISKAHRTLANYWPVLIGMILLVAWVSSLPIWLMTRASPLQLLDSSPIPLSRLLWWKWVVWVLIVFVLSYGVIIWNVVVSVQQIWVVVLLGILIFRCIGLLHDFFFRVASKWWRRKEKFEYRDILRFLTKPGTQSSLITWWCTILMILLSWTVMVYSGLQQRITELTQDGDSIFVTNVFEDDIEKLDQLSIDVQDVFSVILGRIVSVNWRSLQDHMEAQNIWPEEQWSFTREFNMTDNTLDDVKILSGKALGTTWEISVDDDFAQRLWIENENDMVLSVAGREFAMKVVNIRSSERNGTRPFFYIQLPQEQFSWAPKTSFFQIPSNKETNTGIKKEIVELMWNNVTFIDTGEVVAQVRSYIERVGSLLLALFLLITFFALSAIFSLFSYASVFQEERLKVYAMLWATKQKRSLVKKWYILIYLLISWIMSVSLLGGFYTLFSESTFLLVTGGTLLRWLWAIVLICLAVWVQSLSVVGKER